MQDQERHDARPGHPKPKAGLVAYASPRWTHEIIDCALPMVLDTYNQCSYGCLYCFAQFQKSVGHAKRNYVGGRVGAFNVPALIQLFSPNAPAGRDRHHFGIWQFGQYVRARKVVQWGGMSDPFCNLERKHGVGLALMRHLHSIRYPVSFSTKGTWFLDDPRYAELLQGNDFWHFKVSIITQDAAKARAIERGVASPAARLRAIERLAGMLRGDGAVTLRLRPFIMGVSNPGHLQLIQDAANAGATSLSTEFLCVEQRCLAAREKYTRMSAHAGFDLWRYYKEHSRGSGYLRLSAAIKRPIFLAMQEAAHRAGMRFYVSDAHHKELSDGGCCCGLPESWDYSRGQLCEVLQIAKRRDVRFADIDKHLDYARPFSFRRAYGYNSVSEEVRAPLHDATMRDFLRWNWNSPERQNSPYRIFGGALVPVGRDEDGDLVYRSRDRLEDATGGLPDRDS